MEAIKRPGIVPGGISPMLDCAASELLREGAVSTGAEKNPERSSEEMVSYYGKLLDRYPILSIEDGLSMDWKGWKILTEKLRQARAVGRGRHLRDQRGDFPRASRKASANSILIKLNQIGTLTETLDAIELAKRSGYGDHFASLERNGIRRSRMWRWRPTAA